MSTDLVRAIAFAFRRKGADAVAGHDLRFVLAFDLRWLAPEDAKRAIQRALDTGLVREDGDLLRPNFDPHAVEVPLNFRPGPGFLDEAVPTELPVARAAPPQAARVAPAPPAPEEEAARQERARRGNLLTLDAAKLVVARRAGEDVRERAAALAQSMLKPS